MMCLFVLQASRYQLNLPSDANAVIAHREALELDQFSPRLFAQTARVKRYRFSR